MDHPDAAQDDAAFRKKGEAPNAKSGPAGTPAETADRAGVERSQALSVRPFQISQSRFSPKSGARRFVGISLPQPDPRAGGALPIYEVSTGPLPPDRRSERELTRWRKEQARAIAKGARP